MISDEERRNMASSLRHDAAYGEGSLSEWWGRLQFIVLDEDDFPNPRRVFWGLAELIERPTCRNVYDENEMGSCINGFECSECGNMVEDYEGYRVSGEFNYCSKCGAEVVGDD